jgi:hypothetical protein
VATGLACLGGASGLAALVTASGAQVFLAMSGATPPVLELPNTETLQMLESGAGQQAITGDAAGNATIPGGGTNGAVYSFATTDGGYLLFEAVTVA